LRVRFLPGAHFSKSQSFRLAASRFGGQIEGKFPAKT